MTPLVPRPAEPEPERWPDRIDEPRDLAGGEPIDVTEIPGEPASMPAAQAAAGGDEPDRDPAPVPEPSEVEVPTAVRREIERAMRRYPDPRSASIPALWAVQRRYGWCTPEGIVQAATVMGVTPGYLQSVASFYDLFRLEPQGKHQVLVCTNISCWLRGADDVLQAFREAVDAEQPADDVFVRGFECLGACDIAPMASIDERYYGPLEPGDAESVLEALRSKGEVLPKKRLEDRGVAGGKRTAADERITAHPVNKPKRPRPRAGKPRPSKKPRGAARPGDGR